MRLIAGSFRWIGAGLRRLLMLLVVVVVVLGINVVSFTSEALFSTFSGLATRIFGASAVVGAAGEVASLKAEKAALVKTNKALTAQVDELDTVVKRNADELVEARSLARKYGDELAEARGLAGKYGDELADARGLVRKYGDELAEARGLARKYGDELAKLRPVAKQLDNIGARITRRTLFGAGRNIASMPLESVPIVGGLTILAVTSVEIVDACATMSDMEELRQLAGYAPVDASKVQQMCDYVLFWDGPVELSELSVSECRAHAAELGAIDIRVAEEVGGICDCIAARPGFENSCLPEKSAAPPPIILPAVE